MNLKTFPKLLQSPQVKTSSDELPANFRRSSDELSETILRTFGRAPRLHDLILASSNELLRQAPIFLGELRELRTNLPASFRKTLRQAPYLFSASSGSIPDEPSDFRRTLELPTNPSRLTPALCFALCLHRYRS